MIGIDPDYQMSRDYMAQSWPTFVVIDAKGTVRFHGFDTDRDLSGVRRCLKDLLQVPPADPQCLVTNAVVYPIPVLEAQQEPRDRFPRLVFDKSGAATVVFN